MTDFVTLSCPSCGGKLQVTPDLEQFACAFCGNEHIVRRGGGVVSLVPLEERMSEVRDGVDKVASELAIKRLQEELKRVEAARALHQVGKTAGYVLGGLAQKKSDAQLQAEVSNRNWIYLSIGSIAVLSISFVTYLYWSTESKDWFSGWIFLVVAGICAASLVWSEMIGRPKAIAILEAARNEDPVEEQQQDPEYSGLLNRSKEIEAEIAQHRKIVEGG